MFSRWGGLVARRRWTFLLVSLAVVAAAAVAGLGVFGSLSDGGFDDKASESTRQVDAEQDSFGRGQDDVVVIYRNDDMLATDPDFQTAVTRTVAALPGSAVARATTYYETPAPQLLSNDGHATLVTLTLAGESDDELAAGFDAIADRLEAPGLTAYVGGQQAVFADINTQVGEDIARAESLSMPIVLVLCVLIFGSVVAALLPVGIGAIAILGAFGGLRLLTEFTEVSVFAINVITLLGLGLAIDYALFMVSRFREEMARQATDGVVDVPAAVAATVATAGRTVAFSGLTVAAALSSLLLFPQNFLRSMGLGGMLAVLVAMVAALTILPAVLAVLGPRVDRLRVPWRRRDSRQSSGTWARIGRSVMRRPVVYVAAITIALLAIASPFLGVRWGSVDSRALPQDAPSRVADERLAADFPGGEETTARITVTGAAGPQLSAYAEQVAAVDGVTGVRVAAENASAAVLEVAYTGDPQSTQSRDLIGAVRDVPAPTEATALVGGETAQLVDLLGSLGDRLPWMGAYVVVVMFVLLFLAFGSLVLPLKAIAMNAISIVASFGVVTWVFGEGHLSGLLDFTSTGAVDATQPILMLAILFGLSMDYEVFLLSRVREEWDVSRDNTEAVLSGLQRTGGIITSAALLLAVVIGAFATSGITFIKLIGVGMIVALIIDATVVRALLVPATMRLLGGANWWAPGPLRRWWDRHGFRESAEMAPAEPALSRT